MKVAFYTLGCRVNSYDSNMMAELFRNEGFEICDYNDKADIYVINSCSVTNESERKSRQMVRRFKNNHPDCVVILTGCFPQSNIEQAKNLTEADIVCGTFEKMNIVNYALDFLKNKVRIVNVKEDNMSFEALPFCEFDGKTRATLKVQDGCNMFCSYCIIPYARGRSKSRSVKDILSQVKLIDEKGINEVVITGIHVASFRGENKEKLIDLIELINDNSTIARIRLGSLEPNLITEEFLERLYKIDKFCPSFHLSLQSGSDNVLRRMNRKYTSSEYEAIVNNIRKYYPLASITTDVIVGFPGESEEEFKQTVDFVKKINFSFVHIFPYSKKKGTKAELMENQIPKHIKEERAKILKKEVIGLKKDFINKNLNKVHYLLTEKKNSKGYITGYSENYIHCVIKDDSVNENEIKKVVGVGSIGEDMLVKLI